MCPQPVDIGGKAALQRPLRLKAEHASRLVDRERALRVEFGERTPADRDLRIGQQPAREVCSIGQPPIFEARDVANGPGAASAASVAAATSSA